MEGYYSFLRSSHKSAINKQENFQKTSEANCARNGAAFAFELMDSEDDAEIAMRLAVLDSISKHIVASTEQTGKIWHITVDDEILDRSSTDSNAHVGPEVMKFVAASCDGVERFEEALCAICRGELFENQSDGRIFIDAREMKCPGRHTFHAPCAQVCFVPKHTDRCPCCRHNFRDSFCADIATSLEHIEPNENEPLQWMKTPTVRLAALNMLAKLSEKTPLGRSTASALLWSTFDSSLGIANAALNTERLADAFEAIPETRPIYIQAVLTSLKMTGADRTVHLMTRAIAQLSECGRGRVAILEAGGCGAIVQALNVAKTDDTICSIALAIRRLLDYDDCRIRCFREFSEHSVCFSLLATTMRGWEFPTVYH